MSYLKLSHFFFKLRSWELTLQYFFSWNFILFWRREPIRVPNFRLSISPNLYLDRLLLLKVYKISAKKVQRSCVSWHWRLMQNLKKNWFVVSKLTRIWGILFGALKSLKNLHFDLSLPWKVCNVWSKKYRGVIFHDTREWCKIWRKTNFGLENNIKNLANFHQSTCKSQNGESDGILLSKVENIWA